MLFRTPIAPMRRLLPNHLRHLLVQRETGYKLRLPVYFTLKKG